MRAVPLGRVAEVNPGKPRDLQPDALCSFVPMEFVDDTSGSILQTGTRRVAEVEKGYTPFRDGDVLFAKITPCMENGKCAVARGLTNGLGFGSTEFHVLRPGDEIVAEWAFYFLRQESTKREAARHMTGTAGQQRVPTRFLEEVAIPLPPLPEQQRIAAILSKADRLRRLRRYARTLSDGCLHSIFLHMFGDPIDNPHRWDSHRLRRHLRFLTSGSRGWAQYYVPSGPRFIRSLDVQMNQISHSDAVFVNPPVGAEAGRTRVLPGDVLLTITGSRIGRVAYVAPDLGEAYVSQHVAILRLDGFLRPHFLSMFMSLPSGGQQQIARLQYGQTKPGLNFGNISSFEIPCPPPSLQDRFGHVVQMYDRLRAQQREAERQAEHLFQTLLHRAFTGGL